MSARARAIRLVLLGALVAWLGAAALAASASGTAKGLRIPLPDADGRVARILSAREATGTLAEAKLRDAVVDFFPPDPAAGGPAARLSIDAATYFEAKGLIVGEGGARLHTSRGDITGRHCSYDLRNNRLAIRGGF